MKNNDTKDKASNPLPSGRDYVDPLFEWRNLVKELKAEWKMLWRTRIDDRVRAEGVASRDFLRLFIDRGTIISATRDCKPPSFHEILRYYMPEVAAQHFNVSPHVGGWGKFIREFIRGQSGKRENREALSRFRKKANLQMKKGGRGWLHYTLE